MSFDNNTLSLVGGTRPGVLTYTYSTTDDIDTVIADNYFGPSHTRLRVNDLITIVNNEGTYHIRIISVATNAVISQLVVAAGDLDDTITDDTRATTTRSVIAGKNPDGDYVNVPVDIDGWLKTSPTDKDLINSELLAAILSELQVMNMHLKEATDTEFTIDEVSDGYNL